MISRSGIVLSVLLVFSSVTLADTWARFAGSGRRERVSDFTATADGAFVLAGAQIDPINGYPATLLIKFDTNGNVGWQKQYVRQGFHDEALSVQQTADGGVVFTTQRNVVKLSSSGDVQWAHGFVRTVFPSSALELQDGNFVIVGSRASLPLAKSWVSKVDASGVPQWEYTFGCGGFGKAIQTGDGNVIIGGSSCKTPNGDATLVKISASGNVLWSKVYVSDISGSQGLVDFSETDDLGYILALGAENQLKVMKLDSSGNVVWVSLYDSSASRIAQTNDGGYVILNGTRFLKLNHAGDVEWEKSYRGIKSVLLRGVSQAKGGNYVIGGLTVRTQHQPDFLLMKVDPGGNINAPCIHDFDHTVAAAPTQINVLSNTNLHVRKPPHSSFITVVVDPVDFSGDSEKCSSNQ